MVELEVEVVVEVLLEGEAVELELELVVELLLEDDRVELELRLFDDVDWLDTELKVVWLVDIDFTELDDDRELEEPADADCDEELVTLEVLEVVEIEDGTTLLDEIEVVKKTTDELLEEPPGCVIFW